MDPIQQEIIDLKMRVERLEHLVGQLRGAPIVPPPVQGFEAEVQALVQAGNMLEAIKVYREHTRCSLLEAKTRVEAMRR